MYKVKIAKSKNDISLYLILNKSRFHLDKIQYRNRKKGKFKIHN